MSAAVEHAEQTILKVVCPPVPDVAYAVRTFRIDLQRWCLQPVDPGGRSVWSGNYGVSQCDTPGHYGPRLDCGCGIAGQHSVDELRATHPEADTVVAVMEYDPIRAIETANEVRAMSAHLVAYWISPDLPGHELAAAVFADQTGGQARAYHDVDTMLADYCITGRAESVDNGAGADDIGQAATVARRPWRSWASVFGDTLRESFADAWTYTTVTAKIMLQTLLLAGLCVALHHLIRTRPQSVAWFHGAWFDPVLLAGRHLLFAVDTPPVLLTAMAAIAVGTAVRVLRWTRPLPPLSDPSAWVMNVLVPYVYTVGHRVTVYFGMLFILTAAAGRPESPALGWLLVAMFVLGLIGRSVTPVYAILGRRHRLRAQRRAGDAESAAAQ